jgi:hypothetical protein
VSKSFSNCATSLGRYWAEAWITQGYVDRGDKLPLVGIRGEGDEIGPSAVSPPTEHDEGASYRAARVLGACRDQSMHGLPPHRRQIQPPHISHSPRANPRTLPATHPEPRCQSAQKLQPPRSRRLAHPHQPSRPQDASVLGDEGPKLGKGGGAVDGPVGVCAPGDGGRHACPRCALCVCGARERKEGRATKRRKEAYFQPLVDGTPQQVPVCEQWEAFEDSVLYGMMEKSFCKELAMLTCPKGPYGMSSAHHEGSDDPKYVNKYIRQRVGDLDTDDPFDKSKGTLKTYYKTNLSFPFVKVESLNSEYS